MVIVLAMQFSGLPAEIGKCNSVHC